MLLLFSVARVKAQGQCSLRTHDNCISVSGCAWCKTGNFCTTAGNCPLDEQGSLAGLKMPTQYEANISALSVDGNDPLPDFESSTWHWDAEQQASAVLGTSGPSLGLRSIAYTNPSNQLAVATSLVALSGMGTAEGQEQVL